MNGLDILKGGMIADQSDGGCYTDIYFLIDGTSVVYVGQSADLDGRLLAHRSKIFNKISYMRVPFEDGDFVEAECIVKLNPKYNRTLTHTVGYARHLEIADMVSRHIRENLHKSLPASLVCYKNKASNMSNGNVTHYLSPDHVEGMAKIICEYFDYLIPVALNEYEREVNKARRSGLME